jgi:6-phospho-3-hexuloisomerase
MGIGDYLDGIIAELRTALAAIDNAQAERLADAILNAEAVYVSGAGRSGLAMRSFAMRLMHIGITAHVVGETTTPGMTDKDLLIVGSGSGSTRSLVVHADTARSIGGRVGLITIDKDSVIAVKADVVLTIPAPTPKIARDTGASSIQPMGSLFEQGLLLTLDGVVLLLMEKTGQTTEKMFGRHANLE